MITGARQVKLLLFGKKVCGWCLLRLGCLRILREAVGVTVAVEEGGGGR